MKVYDLQKHSANHLFLIVVFKLWSKKLIKYWFKYLVYCIYTLFIVHVQCCWNDEQNTGIKIMTNWRRETSYCTADSCQTTRPHSSPVDGSIGKNAPQTEKEKVAQLAI